MLDLLVEALTARPALLTAFAAAAVFLAAITQTVTGQSFGVVVAPPLAIAAPETLPAAALLLGIATAGMNLGGDRGRIDWRLIAPALVGRTIGAALAGWLLMYLHAPDAIATTVGLFVLLAVGLSLFGPRLPITTETLLGAGALSGLMATLTAVGAPPMGLLFQHERGARVRASLNAFFFIGMLISLAVVIAGGRFPTAAVVFAALLVIPMVLGFVAGRRISNHMEGKSMRPAVLTLAAFAAVGALWRGLS